MRVADYKQLRVYRLAFESAMEVFNVSKQFPSDERFSLTDQIRRSSRSVCASIAEAWRKRRYEAAFISKLSDGDTEAAETEVHLDFALKCGYLDAESHARLRDRYDHICRQLARMMAEASSWCSPGRELRELRGESLVGEAAGSETRGQAESSGVRVSDRPRSKRSNDPKPRG